MVNDKVYDCSPPDGGLVFILSSGKDERQQQDPVNPVNPVQKIFYSDRINRMYRMVSPFPDEKEKAPCLRQLRPWGSFKACGGISRSDLVF